MEGQSKMAAVQHVPAPAGGPDEQADIKELVIDWRKAEASSSHNDNCVELGCVALGGEKRFAAIRDSKNPESGFLPIGTRAIQALVESAKT